MIHGCKPSKRLDSAWLSCRALKAACALLACTMPARAMDLPTAATTASPTATQSAPVPISGMSDDELLSLYPSALLDAYRTQDNAKLLSAHRLIESYFLTPKAADRAKIVAQIEALNLNPVAVARLVRIRMHWPALAGGGVYYINQKRGPYDAKYFVGLPQNYDRRKSWPLVVKLPTAQAFATNPAPDANDVVKIYSGWIHEELNHHPDAVVVMPLLDLKELYGPSYAGMNDALQPIIDVGDRVNIDPARVYLFGHAEAAHAVWNLALHCPTYFAAINPLAGAASFDWQRLRLVNLSNILPVVWADDDDNVIKPSNSQSLVAVLRKLKQDVEFVQTKHVGHAPSDDVLQECYDKTTARVRELYPASVSLQSNRPDSVFNRNDWVQIYQAINPGDDRRLYFRHGTGYMVVDANTWRIDAIANGNTIRVTTDNVESFRLYLNDTMFDLSRAITVIVNRRPKFEAIVKPNLAAMLQDQLVLGRGWRSYLGTIDIDLAPPLPPATNNSTSQPTTQPHKGRIIVGPAADE